MMGHVENLNIPDDSVNNDRVANSNSVFNNSRNCAKNIIILLDCIWDLEC